MKCSHSQNKFTISLFIAVMYKEKGQKSFKEASA